MDCLLGLGLLALLGLLQIVCIGMQEPDGFSFHQSLEVGAYLPAKKFPIINSIMYFLQALISTPGIEPEVANHADLTPVEVAGEKYDVIQTINNFLKQKQSSLQTYLKYM